MGSPEPSPSWLPAGSHKHLRITLHNWVTEDSRNVIGKDTQTTVTGPYLPVLIRQRNKMCAPVCQPSSPQGVLSEASACPLLLSPSPAARQPALTRTLQARSAHAEARSAHAVTCCRARLFP